MLLENKVAVIYGVAGEDCRSDHAETDAPLLAEVANVAALMASDHAGVITGAVTNVTCGELAD